MTERTGYRIAWLVEDEEATETGCVANADLIVCNDDRKMYLYCYLSNGHTGAHWDMENEVVWRDRIATRKEWEDLAYGP